MLPGSGNVYGDVTGIGQKMARYSHEVGKEIIVNTCESSNLEK